MADVPVQVIVAATEDAVAEELAVGTATDASADGSRGDNGEEKSNDS